MANISAEALRFVAMDLNNNSVVEYREFSAAVADLVPEDTSKQKQFLGVIDVVIFAVFWTELILKVVAHGFLLTPHAYLADPWNQFGESPSRVVALRPWPFP